MTNVVIRHLSGSRANQVDEFPLEDSLDLSFGRDPSSNVAFDPDRDDLVSRSHATITRSADDETRFTLTDLGSSNGTFLNGSRIQGSVDITVGDTVRFGDGGPEFSFDLDPRPDWAMRATRIGTPIAQTRIGSTEPASTAPAGDAPKSSVGRATVERMIDRQAEGQRKNTTGMIAAVLALMVILGGFLIWRSGETEENIAQQLEAQQEEIAKAADRPQTPREISDAFAETVVFIEFAWKLYDTGTGQQVFHRYIDRKPAYLTVNGKIVPWLILDDEDGTNAPIGVAGATGTGFVVTENGFILTNRHVAANWQSRWNPVLPGALYSVNGDELTKVQDLGPEAAGLINFVPARAAGQAAVGKKVEGRLDYLDVTFRKNKLRIPARLVRVSDSADVALIKVDLATSVDNVELLDNYEEIRAGDPITVMGYPGVSPSQYVATTSQDAFNREATVRAVPEPTVSSGNIGKVLRGTAELTDDQNLQFMSEFGDMYQLTINSTGPGNSGGPVFDDDGKVVAIFSAGNSTITFAVPIKYGIELMDIRKVIN